MEDETQVGQYVALPLHWLWLIVLVALLAAGVVWLAARSTAPTYQATATLLVKESESVAGPASGDAYRGESLTATYAQLLCSPSIVREASERAGGGAEHAQVLAAQVKGTSIVHLTVRDPDPARAARLANTIPNVLIEVVNKEQASRLAASTDALKEEMGRVAAEVETTQADLGAQLSRPQPDQAEVTRLESLLAQRRATYAGLLQAYEGVRVTESRSMDTLSIIEPAPVPGAPVPSRRGRNMLLAGLAGAVLATGAGLLVERLRGTVKRPEDVARMAHLPVLATIIRFSQEELDASGPLIAGEAQPSTAKAYRVLRTNLQFATASTGHSVAVLVTSAAAEEGKTTTLVNLGVALAQSGKRVLLVDADLRRPTLHRRFGLANEAGLTTLFLDPSASLDGLIRATDVQGLSVLTSGPTPADPTEVLMLPRTGELLDALRARADYLLLDSPSVLGAADASVLAQEADGVLLVAKAGHTRLSALKNATLCLRRVRARLLGVVLNRAHARHQDSDRELDSARAGKRGRRQRPLALRRQLSAGLAGDALPSRDPVARAAHSAMNARRRRRKILRAVYLFGGAAGAFALGALALLAYQGQFSGAATHEPATATAAPAPTEPATPTFVPSATSSPTLTPTEPATPTSTATPSPTATSTPRPLPTATSTVAVGLHGASVRLHLPGGEGTYAAGQPVAFRIELENTTTQPLAAGIVGLKPDGGLPFQSSATGVIIEPGAVYLVEAQLTFPAAGTYSVVASACFSPEESCRAGTGAWEEFAPGVVVTVQ